MIKSVPGINFAWLGADRMIDMASSKREIVLRKSMKCLSRLLSVYWLHWRNSLIRGCNQVSGIKGQLIKEKQLEHEIKKTLSLTSTVQAQTSKVPAKLV